MTNEVIVEVEQRSDGGKNYCRRIRKTGMVPAVVYGLDRPSVPITVESRAIESILRLESGKNTIFKLAESRQGEQRAVMIREIQRDPVTEQMVHVDFVRLDLEKKLTVSVPIRLVGTPTGVKNEGGVIDFMHRNVQAECLPADIPEHFDLDVSELQINQHVSVADIKTGEGVELLEAPGVIIAVVTPPRAEAEPAAEEAEAEVAAAEGEEPEVIGKGKETESGGEAESKGE